MSDDHQDVLILKRELLGLFHHIQKIRKEIAAIRRPGQPEQDHFSKMSDELDAIVAATEHATNTIMENVEQMEDVLDQVRSRVADDEAQALLDTIPEKTGAIFEACTFQDITGQRITKVVNSLQYVEERVNALISIWGENAIATEKVDEEAAEGERKYLNGPQLQGQGVSQADVDALFGEGSAAPSKAAAGAAPKAPSRPQQQAARPAPPAASAKPAAGAAKPSAAPPSKPAPKPAPKKDAVDGDGGGGESFSQDDIDKLFG